MGYSQRAALILPSLMPPKTNRPLRSMVFSFFSSFFDGFSDFPLVFLIFWWIFSSFSVFPLDFHPAWAAWALARAFAPSAISLFSTSSQALSSGTGEALKNGWKKCRKSLSEARKRGVEDDFVGIRADCTKNKSENGDFCHRKRVISPGMGTLWIQFAYPLVNSQSYGRFMKWPI